MNLRSVHFDGIPHGSGGERVYRLVFHYGDEEVHVRALDLRNSDYEDNFHDKVATSIDNAPSVPDSAVDRCEQISQEFVRENAESFEDPEVLVE